MDNISDIILPQRMTDPDCRRIQPRAPRQWKRTRPFKEQFVAGFHPIAPTRRSCELTQDPLYLYEAFSNHSRIGQGSFGVVYRATCNETNENCAIKVLRVSGIQPWKGAVERVFLYERINMHENVVKLYNTWVEDDALYIQMELCQKSLLHFILENSNVAEQCLWDVLIDMLQALEFIHAQGLVHLDVKPENILIGYDDRYKLSDFDLIQDSMLPIEKVRAGDDKYRAPEVTETAFVPNPKNDIFSLGMTLLEMAGDFSLPNGGIHWKLLRTNNLPYSQLKQKVTANLIEILHRMLEPNVIVRPSAKDILLLDEIQIRRIVRHRTLKPESSVVKKLSDVNLLKLKQNLEFLATVEEERGDISRLGSFIHNQHNKTQSPLISPDEIPAKKLKCMRRLFSCLAEVLYTNNLGGPAWWPTLAASRSLNPMMNGKFIGEILSGPLIPSITRLVIAICFLKRRSFH